MFVWLRRSYQAIFLIFFLFLVFVSTSLFIRGYDVQWFLELDPLPPITNLDASVLPLADQRLGLCRAVAAASQLQLQMSPAILDHPIVAYPSFGLEPENILQPSLARRLGRVRHPPIEKRNSTWHRLLR